ncbi:MAG: mechanosensitive ion channel [Alphaproteobacteria bacterium]|nr:mechanosensitive ion channel [Alphaproteobacteria bacterium]
MSKFLSLILVSSLLFVTPCKSENLSVPQKQETTKEEITTKQEFDYKKISEQFNALEDGLKNNNLSKEDLDKSQDFLNQTELFLTTFIKEIEKEAKYTQDALTAIGVPEEGEVEDASITEMREKYTQSMSVYKGKQIEANLLKTEISRLTALISEARSRLLIGDLVSTPNTIINTNNFIKAFNDAGVFIWDIVSSPFHWYKSLNNNQKQNVHHNILSVLLTLIAILSFGIFLRNFIINHYGYRHTDEQPRYGQKIVVAIITAIAYGVIPSLLIGGCLVWQISNQTLLNSNFGIALANILYYALYIILAKAITRVILAPWNGKWRLFNITDYKAERIFRAATLCIILIGSISCIINISSYFSITDEFSLLLEVLADGIKAISVILLTTRIFENKKSKNNSEEPLISSQQEEDDETSPSFKIIVFTSIFSIITFSISLLGYPGLSTFIFNRFILSVLLLGSFIIAKKLISDILRRSIVFWISTFKLRKRLLSKLDFAMSLIITPILGLFFIYSLLRLWGVSGTFMLHLIKKIIFGFKVGGIEISLLAICTGFVVFIVSITLVKLLKNRLSNNLLNRINIDEGIKHSLISGINFIGIIISLILAVIAMGVDLSNLAVIAGALSVGIGFGLQDVIKNLVSGIIILFERPFKVGDWVIINGEEGKIKQINIRSTELETWTRQSVIIPNATLISNSLINLTHENNWQRQSIKVGVSYDSDADLVTQLLLECAKSCKKVTKVPAPYVIFKDFGSSSLDFELRYYISDIWEGWSAASDIRYEILKKFRENGINIAYPQIVVHKGSYDTSVKGWQTNV